MSFWFFFFPVSSLAFCRFYNKPLQTMTQRGPKFNKLYKSLTIGSLKKKYKPPKFPINVSKEFATWFDEEEVYMYFKLFIYITNYYY